MNRGNIILNKITRQVDNLLGNVLLWAWCCTTFSRPSAVREKCTNDNDGTVRLLILFFVVLIGFAIQTFICEWFSWWYVLIYFSLALFLCLKDEVASAKNRKEVAIQKEIGSHWQSYNGEKITGKVNIELLDGNVLWNVDSSHLEENSGNIKKWMHKNS